MLHDWPEYHEARFELIHCLRKLRRWDRALREADYLLGFRRLATEAQQLIDEIRRERIVV